MPIWHVLATTRPPLVATAKMASCRNLGACTLQRALGWGHGAQNPLGVDFDRRWNLRAVFLGSWQFLRGVRDDPDDFAPSSNNVLGDDDQPIPLPEHSVRLRVRLIPHEHFALAHRVELASVLLSHVCDRSRSKHPHVHHAQMNASHGICPCALTGILFQFRLSLSVTTALPTSAGAAPSPLASLGPSPPTPGEGVSPTRSTRQCTSPSSRAPSPCPQRPPQGLC